MTEHFIKNIEIKNFKCFEDFKAEGFGRVNLIGGKNNVGKTAFMEACCLNANKDKFLYFLSDMIKGRDNFFDIHRGKKISSSINYFYQEYYELTKKFELNTNYVINTNINNLDFKFTYKWLFLKSIEFKINNEYLKWKWLSLVKYKNISKKVLFLGTIGIADYEIGFYYEKLNDKKKFNENLNRFDKNFESLIEVERDFFIKTKDNQILNLKEFGDGIKQYINILLFFSYASNGYIFIDEIDNGIHYSNLDKLWEIILTISKEQNVQVFATTHSKECIESYARVAKKLEDEEIKYIKMSQLKDGKIMAGVRDYEMLQYTMSDGHEVRGV